MPNRKAIHDAAGFWDAPEFEAFPLSVIACALGINRNDMKNIPGRFLVEKRAYYYKSTVLGFMETEGGKETIAELREKQRRIDEKKWEREKLEYFAAQQIHEFRREVWSGNWSFPLARWPEDDQTKEDRISYLKALGVLWPKKMGGLLVPNGWWLIDDDEQRSEAHRLAYLKSLTEELNDLENRINSPPLHSTANAEEDWKIELAEVREELRRVSNGH